MGKSLREIVKFLHDSHNLEQSLRTLEANGDINSNGEITVYDAIKEISGCRIEYYLQDFSKAKGNFVIIGFNTGRSDRSLAVTEEGKLYLSKWEDLLWVYM